MIEGRIGQEYKRLEQERTASLRRMLSEYARAQATEAERLGDIWASLADDLSQ